MGAIRAELACGEVIVKEERGHLRLQADGLLARAPEMAMKMTNAVATYARRSWNPLVLGLEGEKTLQIGKKNRLVPFCWVELPDDLRYNFQQGPNTLPAVIKACKREKHTDCVSGWCLTDDERLHQRVFCRETHVSRKSVGHHQFCPFPAAL